MNVVAVGRGDNDNVSLQGGLCKELETQSRDRTPTNEVDALSFRERRRHLFGESEEVGLPNDVRGGQLDNLDHITPIPGISHLRFFTVFIPLAYTDRYEVRRALAPKKTKVNTAISALDWTRRNLDIGTRLEEVVLIVNASSVVDDEGVSADSTPLLTPNVVVGVEGDCSEATQGRMECISVGQAEGRSAYYE
ncbi:hypothetical protein EV421DRAFT_2041875 [Armillaria borealis]|uniref:Uncharacterized protein n=1 Tax=Armillaria borealis TaxID=47425 RepID=A0AA39ME19_9AGAR|nr:hypothetical protein EV421DRAFT_2041875 [Armillaria borealis]